MSKYILRLDDACEKMDIEKWDRMEQLLDKYAVKPLVGVIPHCEDPMMDDYPVDSKFWSKVNNWITKDWSIAMHGYNHVYSTACGGINPINNRSEFAGEPLEVQKEKIRKGISIMREHGVNPKVFFAPSHTFDRNTLLALKAESDINIISDTIANDVYYQDGFQFVPQQSGRVRKSPFKVVTFCYHPNTMKTADFVYLEQFLEKNATLFTKFELILNGKRKLSIFDKVLKKIYFLRKGK